MPVDHVPNSNHNSNIQTPIMKRSRAVVDDEACYSRSRFEKSVSVGDGSLFVSLSKDSVGFFDSVSCGIKIPGHADFKVLNKKFKDEGIFHEIEFTGIDVNSKKFLREEMEFSCAEIYFNMILGTDEGTEEAASILDGEIRKLKYGGGSEEIVYRTGLLAEFVASCLKNFYSIIIDLNANNSRQETLSFNIDDECVSINIINDVEAREKIARNCFSVASGFQVLVCEKAKLIALEQTNKGLGGKAFRNKDDECLNMFLSRLDGYLFVKDELAKKLEKDEISLKIA